MTELEKQINILLAGLWEHEQRVLQLRFGLEDGRSRTLREVGKEFNVTYERIRQIEARALRKLRHPSRSERLKAFLSDKPVTKSPPAEKLLRCVFGLRPIDKIF